MQKEIWLAVYSRSNLIGVKYIHLSLTDCLTDSLIHRPKLTNSTRRLRGIFLQKKVTQKNNNKERYENYATFQIWLYFSSLTKKRAQKMCISVKWGWYPKIWRCPWKIQFLGNARIKTLEDLSKTFWNDLTKFSSRWVWNLRKVLSGVRFFT